jgi:hypothetical protein
MISGQLNKSKKFKKQLVELVEEFVEEEFSPIINKGTGAGGANTNLYGKKFEEKTNNEPRLLEQGFTRHNMNTNKHGYYLTKKFEDKEVIYATQSGFKAYMECEFSIPKGKIYRNPDEVYIIKHDNGLPEIKFIEKKEQNVAGSVEDKLMGGPTFKRMYSKLFSDNFKVEYAFCVNDFLKKKLQSPKKKELNEIFVEDGIAVLFGDDDNYFESLDAWISI